MASTDSFSSNDKNSEQQRRMLSIDLSMEEPEIIIEVFSSERRTLYCEEYDSDESIHDQVPFPYTCHGHPLPTPFHHKAVESTPIVQSVKKELKESKPFNGRDLQQQYKWRKQYDEPSNKIFRRVVNSFISCIRPDPSNAEWTVY
eukprot:CAMPEP_0113679580 /NCGR_PEP_ID=MMETSP0038_2-20120614/10737_1 /TAXON_ID=2898 /ORGANISM="Cryptomonas paramecium" /LENGTH=144 /DNA_ID=CAMNT_0000597655 /DNA_START=51 /DNA_END=485 /DNA_ORIENTATION=+ /assembly_acc=CAM_ASM_000170